MSDQPGNEPEDTLPFTHRPYGDEEPQNPFTSPSGTASQPSGPGYVSPGSGEPQMSSPPPYGPPVPGQPPGQAWAPAYGAPYPGSQKNKRANTSLVLGIIALASLVLAPFLCCITLPGVLCAPFAWGIGAKAKREIDAAPGVYGNRGQAQAGFVMGIVSSLLGVVFVVLAVLWVMLLNSDISLV